MVHSQQNCIVSLFLCAAMNFWSIFTCSDELCPPTKGEGGHISFSADPGRRRRRDTFLSTIFLESLGGFLPDLHGYITGTSQGAD